MVVDADVAAAAAAVLVMVTSGMVFATLFVEHRLWCDVGGDFGVKMRMKGPVWLR